MRPTDEIVEQVSAAREKYAARFNYVLAEMYKDLKAKEQVRGRRVAALPPVDPEAELPGSN